MAGGRQGARKGPSSLVWKWGLRRADMIKYPTFTKNARGCLDICCVLRSYLASLKHMGNQHAHIISGNTGTDQCSTHTVMYLKEKSSQKRQLQNCMMHSGFRFAGISTFDRPIMANEMSCCLRGCRLPLYLKGEVFLLR